MIVSDAERLVGILGNTLPYRDRVAVVTFVAAHGGWNAAADLADLFDLDPQRQEAIYTLTQRSNT